MRLTKITYILPLLGLMSYASATDFNVPDTISPQAQQLLATYTLKARDRVTTPAATDIQGWTRWQQSPPNKKDIDKLLATYHPKLVNRNIAGVPVIDVYPAQWKDNHKVVIYLHGGAYTLGNAYSSLITAVPMANDSNLHIIDVDYALAPQKPWPAAQNQVIAIYQQLIKSGFKPKQIGFLGDSAGGSLVISTLLKLQDSKLPLPAVAVAWSPWADISQHGDSYQTLKNAETAYTYDKQLSNCALAYAPESQWSNPYISPVYGKFTPNFPPTLIQGGTKEIFLSNFVRLYQNMDQSGAKVKLDLYEGMWHVFQGDYTLPEAAAARKKTAAFLSQYLK